MLKMTKALFKSVFIRHATIPLYNCMRGKIMSQFFPQTTLPFSMVNFLKFLGSMYLLY